MSNKFYNKSVSLCNSYNVLDIYNLIMGHFNEVAKNPLDIIEVV